MGLGSVGISEWGCRMGSHMAIGSAPLGFGGGDVDVQLLQFGVLASQMPF